MKLLESSKFKIPKVYFITDREQIKELPVGVPFIFGQDSDEPYMVRLLEYEVLFQEAKMSKYPFNFKKILRDAGFTDIEDFGFYHPIFMEFTTEGLVDEEDELVDKPLTELKKSKEKFKKFVKDSVVYVDLDKLKALNVFPVWLQSIEKAVSTNIHNFAVFNENMYNKKLEGMYGGISLVSPGKNLIIIDISSSIPRAVSSTCLTLSKNLAETFYADLLITGSKSTLYTYEELYLLDVQTVYDENGMGNDQTYFKNIVTKDERNYKTVIAFGDNHSPSYAWSNPWNKGNSTISTEDGKKMCEWKVEKVISFHTDTLRKGDAELAGYATWFEPDEVEHVADWLVYL